MPVPASSANGFAMKHAILPCFAATPRTARLNMIASSTARKASARCSSVISNWPALLRHQRTHRSRARAPPRTDRRTAATCRRGGRVRRPRCARCLARQQPARRAHATLRVTLEQVELEFHGDDRRVAALLQARHYARQHVTWVGLGGAPVEFVQGAEHLCGGALQPARARQRAGDRTAALVGGLRLTTRGPSPRRPRR